MRHGEQDCPGSEWHPSRFEEAKIEFADCPEIHFLLALALGTGETRDCSIDKIQDEFKSFINKESAAFHPYSGKFWLASKIVGDDVYCKIRPCGFVGRSESASKTKISKVAKLFYSGELVQEDGPHDPGGIGEADRRRVLDLARLFRIGGVDAIAKMYCDNKEIANICASYRDEVLSRRAGLSDPSIPRVRLNRKQREKAAFMALKELGLLE